MKDKKEVKKRIAIYLARQKEIKNPNTLAHNSVEFANYTVEDSILRILISELEWVLD